MTDQNESSATGQSVSEEIRDVRYCEVIPVTRKGRTLTAWVYTAAHLSLANSFAASPANGGVPLARSQN